MGMREFLNASTVDVHRDPLVLDEIESAEWLSLEGLMPVLDQLELNALGRVKHGDVPPAIEGAS